MDRLDAICHAAAALRAAAPAPAHGLALLRPLLAARGLELHVVPASEPMLGGAIARLWLHVWEQPEWGGIVWLRTGLAPERQAFAIAHELGHLLLHRGEGIPLRPACDEHEVDESAAAAALRDVAARGRVEEYTPRARREQEASAFAAELLAPRALVRRRFLAAGGVDEEALATEYSISPALARQRLADAVLVGRAEAAPTIGAATAPGDPRSALTELDASQAAAARAAGPALVVAGPGSGKTKTLVGRVAHLTAERGVPPERILALTFSNKAAGEMRERLMQSGLPGERIPVMTIHAFAATLLREYAPYVPHASDEPALRPEFRIIGPADSFLLLEELLSELPLRHYRSLGNPTRHLGMLLADFSRARDGLLAPAAYLDLVAAMPPAPDTPAEAGEVTRKGHKSAPKPPEGTFAREAIAKARERARAYGVWDRALRRRGLVDFGGLILRAVELLRARPDVLAELRGRYPQVLVDEFQDTNHAAAELLMLLAGEQGAGLWVVGDRHQSIYRWRGASPANLPRLAARYPALGIHSLRVCYRSVPAIARLGAALAARMSAAPGTSGTPMHALLSAPVALDPRRAALTSPPPVLRGDTYATRGQERAGLAAAIHRRHMVNAVAYRDQAVLCRTRAQAAGIARALSSAGIPASQQADFFERAEVKDALALLALATGPDARGLLRAPALLAALGYTPPSSEAVAALVQTAVALHEPLPAAFPTLLAAHELERTLTAEQRTGLKRLGGTAQALRFAPTLGDGLERFLLLPGGYAWRLARVADGLDAPQPDDPIAALASRSTARMALEALGELLRLARTFDQRWYGEEGFRERLARAARRMPPHVAGQAHHDAMEQAPGADVATGATNAEDAAESPIADAVPGDPRDAHPVAAEQGEPPAVACFVRYLGALRGVEPDVALPAPDDDAVQVMTIHASKGLEFPIVYLPALASGQFPSRGRPDDPQPPGFRDGDDAAEREAEERCLFYVALTRARDSVVLTRAAAYGRQSAHPSPLLALLDESADYAAAVPLHTEAELAALPWDDAAPGDEEDEEDGESWPDALPAVQGPRQLPPREYALHELEQYLLCPRQYKYARRYHLLDPAESAVYRFHRFVRRGLRELGNLRREAPAAEWDEAERGLRAAWEADGPAGHAYDAYYWSHAEEILRDEWARVTQAPAETGGATERVRLAETYVAALPGCRVRVTADRVVRPAPDMANAPDTPEVLVRLHTGRPRPDDEKDLALPLLYLAYTQRHAGREPRIQLVYLGRPLDGERPPAPTAEGGAGLSAAQAERIVDVTDAARTCAQEFLRPGRKRANRLDKLLRAAAGIEGARFEPRPESVRCAACAFCAVCPADPDADTLAATAPAADALPAALLLPISHAPTAE